MGTVGLREKFLLEHEGLYVFVGRQQQIRWGELLLVHALDPSRPSGGGREPSTNVASMANPSTEVPAILAFGESLVDAETNNFIGGSITLADFLPYGTTFFHSLATGRFSDGGLALEFIASRLGLPFASRFLKPGAAFQRGIKLASGGSGVLSDTMSFGDGVIPLTTQVSQFHRLATKLTSSGTAAAAAGNLISKSMHFFATGSCNELSAIVLENSKSLQQNVSYPAKFVTAVVSEFRAHGQMHSVPTYVHLSCAI
ncbi:unnamed protein product [Calypogeia fissa]